VRGGHFTSSFQWTINNFSFSYLLDAPLRCSLPPCSFYAVPARCCLRCPFPFWRCSYLRASVQCVHAIYSFSPYRAIPFPPFSRYLAIFPWKPLTTCPCVEALSSNTPSDLEYVPRHERMYDLGIHRSCTTPLRPLLAASSAPSISVSPIIEADLSAFSKGVVLLLLSLYPFVL